jgi:RNA polymerase sigma-70 factor (ECF subfamily)
MGCAVESSEDRSAPGSQADPLTSTSSMAGALAAPTALTFDRIYSDHFTFIWRSLRGLGVSPQWLDDAAQQVMLAVHRRLAEFEGRSTLRTWLFGIAYRVALNHRRAARRRAPTEAVVACLEHSSPGPDVRAEAREALEFVEHFLDGLPEKKRALFVLALIEQLPAPEIAATFGLPVNTVYSRVRLLREEFRHALARHYGGSGK